MIEAMQNPSGCLGDMGYVLSLENKEQPHDDDDVADDYFDSVDYFTEV